MSACSGMMELVDHVRLGRADAARELQELGRRELLCSGDKHLMLVKGVFYFFKCTSTQGSQINFL